MGTCVYLWVKYLKNVLKYKYLSIIMYRYLSTSTQVHEKYLSTYLSTNVLKYSSSLLVRHLITILHMIVHVCYYEYIANVKNPTSDLIHVSK